jgi:hypothetical protein
LPKQTSNVFFSSPYLIQRAWTSSMFCHMSHCCKIKVNCIISNCVSLFYEGKIWRNG